MPEIRPPLHFSRSVRNSDTLRIARRMHQLACEIHAAYKRNDLAMVTHASTLLGPTLAQWQTAPPIAEPAARAEAARLARETHLLLDQSIADLTRYMSRITGELQRLRKAQQTLSRLKGRRTAPTGRRLDLRY